ncbi:MAG: BrnT family toxin [Nitrospinae bacterium]|nr:BrnT family toxin [Nitrospinota bacterium]
MYAEAEKAEGFDRDKGNVDKNREKHGVSRAEREETFLNSPLFIKEDSKRSTAEKRFFALGQTFNGRRLAVVYTMRGKMIRTILARDSFRRLMFSVGRSMFNFLKSARRATSSSI